MLSISRNSCANRISSFFRLGAVALRNRQIRNYSESEECDKKEPESKCGLAILREYPCGLKPTQLAKPKEKKKRPDLVSMWKLEDCEPDLCVMDLRYDMKYYRISDKRKRKFQVTWTECPRLIIKPKKVCINEKLKRPKFVRRKRGPAGFAKAESSEAGKPDTAKPPKRVCVYIKAPCCKIGRKPPKCKSAFRSLGSCEKRRAPYPSFSECKKDAMLELPPVECRCLDTPATCDAWAMLRRRITSGKPVVKKCGEA